LKKSPTGPAFTKGPLKNKSGITSNNKEFTFIADNSMNRLVCLRWISKTQRKENFSREAWYVFPELKYLAHLLEWLQERDSALTTL
jgi:hypothetical protein